MVGGAAHRLHPRLGGAGMSNADKLAKMTPQQRDTYQFFRGCGWTLVFSLLLWLCCGCGILLNMWRG